MTPKEDKSQCTKKKANYSWCSKLIEQRNVKIGEISKVALRGGSAKMECIVKLWPFCDEGKHDIVPKMDNLSWRQEKL